ncbi:2-dehydropantoate 2-reductase (Ketopantoate reductase) (KPA reductase) (KPR) [Colletotrichum sp. CLE4]
MCASASHPNWLACVTTHGVTSLGQFKSLHASEADLKVGLVSPNNSADNASYLSNLLAESPHLNGQVVARDELWILQLEKLVVNSVINPLTAILRCKNGDLFTKKDGTIANIIDSLLMEASNILKALIQDRSVGVILQTAPGMALATEDEMTRKLGRRRRDLLGRFSHKKLKEMLYSVGHKVRENTSSMLQDVRAGKPTEVNEFNGWLVEMAAYLEGRIDVVHHKNLVDLVENNTVLSEESLGKHFSSLTDNRQVQRNNNESLRRTRGHVCTLQTIVDHILTLYEIDYDGTGNFNGPGYNPLDARAFDFNNSIARNWTTPP